jgi:hypothetical protein
MMNTRRKEQRMMTGTRMITLKEITSMDRKITIKTMRKDKSTITQAVCIVHLNSRYGKPESLHESAPNELKPMPRQFKNYYESTNNWAETQRRHKGLVLF